MYLQIQGCHRFPLVQNKVFMPDLLGHLLPGAVGGISLVLVGHPFDLVKVRLQTSPVPSLRRCLIEIVRGRGFRGFYQGVTVPLLGVVPVFGMYYGTFKIGRDFLDKRDGGRRALNTAFAGACAATVTALVACPAERLKTILQLVPPTQPTGFNALFNLAGRLYSSGGLRTLYSGLSLMLAKDVPGSIIYFSVYERIKQLLVSQTSSDIFPIIFAGGFAGVSSWVLTAPLDTLKSIRQSQASPGGTTPAWAMARSIWRRDGLRGFWRGLIPSVGRSFPANAACFGGIEAVHVLLGEEDYPLDEP